MSATAFPEGAAPKAPEQHSMSATAFPEGAAPKAPGQHSLSPMRIGIVGAGVAGLVTAKVLSRVGHEVVVFDRTPDVGGVWSAARRYPGVTTQSPRDTYALSDFPMPRSYPEWPTGEQVQQYLADYAAHFGVDRLLRLNTEVLRAAAEPDGWTLTVRGADGEATEHVDHLVVANGVFSEPFVPAFDGEQDFRAAGGDLRPAAGFGDVEDARDRHVVVVGYGKTACDIAQEASGVAAHTAVIARQLLWKVPRKVGGVLNFKHLLLTRMGEALFRWQHIRGLERFLHGPGNGLRKRMLNSVGSLAARQYKWKQLGLVPGGAMEDIVKNAIGLVTDGFYEGVAEGRIAVHRDRTIKRLLEKDGAPHVELSDGSALRADLVVCATGYRQSLPFLDDDLVARLRDERGNFQLYRQIQPVDVPALSFAGYNSSFFSPLNAETAALWIAAQLAGELELPAPAQMRAQVEGRLAFMDVATAGHHSHGTKIIPFSLHNVDEVLDDLGANLGRGTRVKQWLNPVNPAAYRKVTETLTARLAAR
jgi:cation diffusion facilitator CzcD-associated flavoprotein CzcO